MISINKQGNAIVIEFTDNDKYLFNGKIEVAPNELIVVTDDSEMATFRKASNGDVLFSQLISDIQIAGSPVTKDTIIDQFATIGFISGEGAVSSVNGQTGDVVITADSLNVYNKTEIDTALEGKQGKLSVGYPLTLDELNNLSLAPEGYATKEELATKQDSLISGYNIKTINGQDLLGQGGIEISGGGTVDSELSETSENPVQNKVITTALNGKQDTLVSGTNIKTINGNSILGEGNIEITGGGSSNKTWYFTDASDFLTNTTVRKVRLSVAEGTVSYGKVSVGDNVILDNDYYFVVLNKYADTYSKYIAIMPIYNVFSNSNVLGYVMEVPDIEVASVQTFKVTMATPVDITMSDTSENAVQNKVIKSYVDGLVGDINSVLTRING